jgi:hypothetical protein
MFDEGKVRILIQLHTLFLFVFAFSMWGAAQGRDFKDKDQDMQSRKADAGDSGNLVKVEGKVHCDKPDPAYAIDVPDRPGHALLLAKRKCNWTEPLVIMGAKARAGEAISFTERMEGTLHVHGFETDILDNGEKLTWQNMGQVLEEKGPATAKGRWSLKSGTGKFRGIKGGGTYEGKLEADETLTLELEGVFDPSEMIGEKK